MGVTKNQYNNSPVQSLEHSNSLHSANWRKHTSRNPLQRWLIERFHAEVGRQLAALIKDQRGPIRVADIGCGEGFTLEYLARRLPQLNLRGVDADPDALAIATLRLAGIDFSQADIRQLPFPDREIDVVLCLEVLEHLLEPGTALQELIRVSRRYLVLSVPRQPFFAAANLLRGRNWRTYGDDPDHRQRWTAGQFVRWVGQYCAVRQVSQVFPWLIVVAEPVASPESQVPSRAARTLARQRPTPLLGGAEEA